MIDFQASESSLWPYRRVTASQAYVAIRAAGMISILVSDLGEIRIERRDGSLVGSLLLCRGGIDSFAESVVDAKKLFELLPAV